MAKIGSGYRQMDAVRKQRSRNTDKFFKDAKTSIKKSGNLFNVSGFFSSIANGILWCIRAVFILTWSMFKFILWCWYMMFLCLYNAVKSIIQSKKKAADERRGESVDQ